MCCTWLAGNAGPKNSPKNHHLGTVAQICHATSSQLLHVSTIRKKLVKPQYLLHMSSQYGELRPHYRLRSIRQFGSPHLISTGFASWQRYCTIHSSTGRQPNFAALNTGSHLYSAGRPSGWALAHILVVLAFALSQDARTTLMQSTLKTRFRARTYLFSVRESKFTIRLLFSRTPVVHST